MNHEVRIEFHGICTHFPNVAPGIPHRVVLPQADRLFLGLMDIGGVVTPYGLPPHLSHVYSPGQKPIVAPGILDGVIGAGVRLHIANAIRPENQSPLPLLHLSLPSLSAVDPHYRYSAEVVLGGRARCYFDLSYEKFEVCTQGEALYGVATVTTEGHPLLRIEPFDGGELTEVKIGQRLVVGNTSISCKDGDANLDFLLHLLTAERGIPDRLPGKLYGFSPGKTSVLPQRLTEGLTKLLDLGYPGKLRMSAEELFPMYETDASCSNSQWP